MRILRYKRNDIPEQDQKTKKSKNWEEISLKDGICAVCGAKLTVTDSLCPQCGFPVISLTGTDDSTEFEEIKKSVQEYRNVHFRKEIERQEKERQEQERLEKERQEQERLERERLEQERLEKEKLERDHLERERLEQERLERERLEQERLEKERQERDRLEREQQAHSSGKAVNTAAGTKKKGHPALIILLLAALIAGIYFFINHSIDAAPEYFDTSAALLESQIYSMESPAAQTTDTDGKSLADPGALTVEAKDLKYKEDAVYLSLGKR